MRTTAPRRRCRCQICGVNGAFVSVRTFNNHMQRSIRGQSDDVSSNAAASSSSSSVSQYLDDQDGFGGDFDNDERMLDTADSAPCSSAASSSISSSHPSLFVDANPMDIVDDDFFDNADSDSLPPPSPFIDPEVDPFDVDDDDEKDGAALPVGPPSFPPSDSDSDAVDESEEKDDVMIVDEASPVAVIANAVMGRPRIEIKLDIPLWDSNRMVYTDSTVRGLIADAFAHSDSNNLTDKAARGLFDLIKSVMPNPMRIPTWDQAQRQLVRDCKVKAKHYVACILDCFIVKQAIEDTSEEDLKTLRSRSCPICCHPYVDSKQKWNRRFIFLGISDRLRMMLEDPVLSSYLHLPWPGTSDEDEAKRTVPPSPPVEPTLDGNCRNLWQSVGWWKYVHKETQGGREGWAPGGRNIVLSFNADGFQPFDRGGITMTPLVCMILNLPENLRHRPEFMLLIGLIPQRESRNMNTQMKFVVDELLVLWETGLTYTDPVDGVEKTVRVKLLFTASDYPAHSHLNRMRSHAHTFGCHQCDVPSYSKFNRMCFDGYGALGEGRAQPLMTTNQYNQRVGIATRARARMSLDLEKFKLADAAAAAAEADSNYRATRAALELRRIRIANVGLTPKEISARDRAADNALSIIERAEQKRIAAASEAQQRAQQAEHDAKVDVGRAASAVMIQLKKLDGKMMDQLKKSGAMNVIDQSVMSRLPYFSIVQHTLLDMMHVTNGVTGKHMVGIAKNRIAAVDRDMPKKPISKLIEAHKNNPYRSVKYHEGAKAFESALLQWKENHDKWLEEQRLVQFRKVYHLSPARIVVVEQMYRLIQAPKNIAPQSKMPFQKSGEMTTHHWVNFSKVYGKYLFLVGYGGLDAEVDIENFTSTPIEALSLVMDLVTSCLASNATVANKVKTDELAKKLASNFNVLIPEIEKCMMMHSLVFHIPATIKMWGPARGYWCFPYERMIGKLSNTIKSRIHPEENLINRYIRSVATHGLMKSGRIDDRDVDEDDAAAHLQPLIRNDALHSMIDEKMVVWPATTNSNSKKSRLPNLSTADGARVDRLVPFLGSTVCDQYDPNRDKCCDYTMKDIMSPIRVGMWNYGLQHREDNRQTGKTRSSWFKILAVDVPNYRQPSRPDIADDSPIWKYLYGRIHHFAELTVPGWRAKPFQLAKVLLFNVIYITKESNFPMIIINRAVERLKEAGETIDGGPTEIICYIDVNKLISIVAVAPLDAVTKTNYLVLPITL